MNEGDPVGSLLRGEEGIKVTTVKSLHAPSLLFTASEGTPKRKKEWLKEERIMKSGLMNSFTVTSWKSVMVSNIQQSKINARDWSSIWRVRTVFTPYKVMHKLQMGIMCTFLTFMGIMVFLIVNATCHFTNQKKLLSYVWYRKKNLQYSK